ncbi:MAG: transcriptional repressor [Candidatus Aenigmarchaeota archaeon]|nr:transcriptional repressor [Candidatus Aenigmarchaeota archaeon]
MGKNRMTSQRLKILEYLRSVKTHPTAEMVYKAVSRDLPAITLATVYRNLNLLAEQGQILRFEIGKEYRFDGDTCCHQHFVCTKCGKLIDIFNKKLSEQAMKSVDSEEFFPKSVRIIFYGTCKKCKKKGE